MSKLIAVSLLSALLLILAIPAATAPAAPSSVRPDDHEALEKCMKELKGATRRMRKSLDEADKKDENLAQIHIIQKALVEAKSLVPGVAAKSEKKAEMILGYRTIMLDCLETSIALERAVLAGKTDDAKAALRRLHELQDSGHATYKVEDEDH